MALMATGREGIFVIINGLGWWSRY